MIHPKYWSTPLTASYNSIFLDFERSEAAGCIDFPMMFFFSVNTFSGDKIALILPHKIRPKIRKE